MGCRCSQEGFVLFAALLAMLFLVLLYSFMQENLRLASFVELHAEHKILAKNNCNEAVVKILKENNSQCKNCEMKINNEKLKYDLEEIVLESEEGGFESEDESNSENKSNSENIFIKLNLSCSINQHAYADIEAFFDPVSKNILSWRLS